ncbi:MAG: lytic transglycosylase domain-containing protein [Aeromicrobium erythreum]
MAARTLSRWQKAGALAPMTVLVVAWGAALTNSGLATADERGAGATDVEVPSSAIERPASVQDTPAGIDGKAGAAGALSTLSTNGIPSAALTAYRQAESLLDRAAPKCNLPWNLVAAIGRVESNHGRTGGNSLDNSGVARPGVYGIPLDGRNGTARITDTDDGALDKDRVYDRAVGPMQFIPGTWRAVAVDADNDGRKNPQDIDDAATAAGIYLCSGNADLSTRDGAAKAVKRYNNSDSYVDLVLRISDAYASGDFTSSPNGTTTAPVLTQSSLDQTLSKGARDRAAREEQKATKPPSKGGGGSTGGGTGGSTGGSTGGGTGGTGGGSTGGSGGNPVTGGSSTVGGAVQGAVGNTPLAPVTKPVTDLLSATEANLRCLLKYPLGQPKDKFDQCVYDLTH